MFPPLSYGDTMRWGWKSFSLGVRFFRSDFTMWRTHSRELIQVSHFFIRGHWHWSHLHYVFIHVILNELLRLAGLNFLICKVEMMIILSLKNHCFQVVVLEKKTLESSFNSKEIKSVHPKGNQPWIFIGRTDAEAEAPIIQPPDAKSWLIGKDPDAGKDWGQDEKRVTEDEMVG